MHIVTMRQYETNSGKRFDERTDAAREELKDALGELLSTALPRVKLNSIDLEVVSTALAENVDGIESAIEQYRLEAGE